MVAVFICNVIIRLLFDSFMVLRLLHFERYECHSIHESSSFDTNEINVHDRSIQDGRVNIDYSFLNGSIHMSPSVFQKSIINYGQLNDNVKKKLATNQCLDFIAFGSSITCAETEMNTPISINKFEDGWTYQLLEFMNSLWPTCYRGSVLSNHTFIQVRCYGPTFKASDVKYTEKVLERQGVQEAWLESVQLERRKQTSKLLSADVIFVETLEERTITLKSVEAFIYSLLTLPSKPNVVYVLASFKFGNRADNIWTIFDSDISAILHNVGGRVDSAIFLEPTVQHYGVPFISVVDAFGPFTSNKSKKWISTEYIGDLTCHPSRMGAKVLSLLIFKYFDDVRDSLIHPFSDFQEKVQLVCRCR